MIISSNEELAQHIIDLLKKGHPELGPPSSEELFAMSGMAMRRISAGHYLNRPAWGDDWSNFLNNITSGDEYLDLKFCIPPKYIGITDKLRTLNALVQLCDTKISELELCRRLKHKEQEHQGLCDIEQIAEKITQIVKIDVIQRPCWTYKEQLYKQRLQHMCDLLGLYEAKRVSLKFCRERDLKDQEYQELCHIEALMVEIGSIVKNYLWQGKTPEVEQKDSCEC